jgi:hypothetical protein
MRTWNNTKQQLPNGKFTVQDWWDDILDNVKEGDKVINGTDTLFICTRIKRHDTKNQNSQVSLHYAKKDETPNNAYKAERYLFSDKRLYNLIPEWKQMR